MKQENFEKSIAYKLYFGLYDQETHKQEIRTVDALQIIADYIASNFGGGTVYSGFGCYRHEDGSTVQEPSLIVEMVDVSFDDIEKMHREIKFILNQESVLVTVSELKYQFA